MNDRLPLPVIDIVLGQFVKILAGLGGLVHVIAEEGSTGFLLPVVKKLTALGIALQDFALGGLLRNWNMGEIQRIALPVFGNKICNIQFFRRLCLLISADHHAGQDIAPAAVKFPLNQNESRAGSCEIGCEGPVCEIAIPPVNEGRHHHLDENGLPSAVSKGQKGALAIEVKGFVSNLDGIMIVF